MDKIGVNIDGIPYIHYLLQKTLRNNEHKEEIEIPAYSGGYPFSISGDIRSVPS